MRARVCCRICCRVRRWPSTVSQPAGGLTIQGIREGREAECKLSASEGDVRLETVVTAEAASGRRRRRSSARRSRGYLKDTARIFKGVLGEALRGDLEVTPRRLRRVRNEFSKKRGTSLVADRRAGRPVDRLTGLRETKIDEHVPLLHSVPVPSALFP